MRGALREIRRGRAVTAVAAATSLVLLSLFAGCSATGVVEKAKLVEPLVYASVLGDEESNFEGRLLQVVIEGLLTGASEQAGAGAYGNILSLLGWGGSGSDNNYVQMQNTLNDIDAGIAEIKTELTAIQSQLEMSTDEIIANTNDPTTAITQITTFDDKLQELSATGTPGKGDRPSILAFAGNVEGGGYCIRTDVNSIGNAIIPPDAVKRPVLDNYARLLIVRMETKGVGLKDAYFALETYFSQLLYYQMQGVTLVVEADTAVSASGGAPVAGTAASYYQHFKDYQLAPEIQNFMDNTWRLIAARGSLAHTTGFLPAEAEGIAARAEFLRTQTLAMDHFGLRAHAVVTSNHSGELTNATASAANGTTYPAKGTTKTISGPIYDSWRGDKVSSSTDYEVVTFDFGAVPAGSYTMSGPAGFSPAAVLVQPYTADYTADPAGKILYGCALGHTRIGALEAFAAGAAGAGRVWHHDGASRVNFGGDLAAGSISVSGDEANDSFSGEIEVDYRFVYDGPQPAIVTIPTQAHTHGSVATAIETGMDRPGSAAAKISATMGVWDATAGKTVSAASSWSKDVSKNQKASIDERLPKTFAFTAQPGHSYTVYFTANVSGSGHGGSATAQLTVDSLKGMQIQF
jgi:hypothetical protein